MKQLIDDLREYAEWAEANIYEVPIMLPDHLKEAADAIEKLKEQVQHLEASRDMFKMAFENEKKENAQLRKEREWIPVTERLPENYTAVLAFNGGCVLELFYNEDGFGRVDDFGWPIPVETPITHWMPLPEPPDGG